MSEDVLDLCTTCHNLVDRIPLHKWPDELYEEGLKSLNKIGRILLLKLFSLQNRNETDKIFENFKYQG